MIEQFEILTDRLCLVLLHSVWQIAAVALVVFVIERISRLSVQMRYRLHVAALLVAIALVPATFFMLPGSPEVTPALTSNSVVTIPDTQVQANQSNETAASLPSIEPGQLGSAVSSAPIADVGDHAFTSATPWMLGIYIIGCLCMLVRLGRSVLQARKQRRSARPLESGPVFNLVQSLSKNMALRCSPVVAFCETAVVPTVVGLAKPTVLLPASVVTGLSSEQLELVLTHELAHIRRGDMFVSMFQRLVEVFLFFNPSIWYLTRRIDALREHCCDEATCNQHANDAAGRLRYASALLRIVELASEPKSERINLGQLAATGAQPSELRRRVARLCGAPYSHSVSVTPFSLAAVSALALAMLIPAIWTSAVQADEPAQEQTAKSFAAGGQLELVALGKDDDQGQHIWWDQDGKSIKPSFEWQRGHKMNGRSDGLQRVVIRLSDLPKGSESTWRIEGSNASGSAGVTVNEVDSPPGYFARHFTVSDKRDSVTVRVGLAAGEWEKVGETSHGHGSYGFMDKRVLLFSGLVDTDNGAFIVASHSFFNTNFRIVAYDKAGNLHGSTFRGGSSANGIYQANALFPGMTRDQIDRVEFQTREYEWLELKDLPLSPSKD